VFGRNLVPLYEIWIADQSHRIVKLYVAESQSLWFKPIKPSQMSGLILNIEWQFDSKNSQNEQ
jgi:hypothetical protein